MLGQKIFSKHKIIIGSANFGLNYSQLNSFKKVNIKEIKKIIRFCEKNKINYLDTANGYGDAEKIIGSVKKDKWKIITKIPKVKTQNLKEIKNFIFNTINISLDNLKSRSLYAVLLHDEKQLLSRNGKKIFKLLKYLKSKGKINKIGVSFYTPSILLKTLSNFKIDIIQIPINYINKNFLDKKILRNIKKNNIEVHARSLFLQGLLLKKKTNNKKFKKFIEYLNNWHYQKKINRLESALNFFNDLNFVDKYILGLENLNQLKQIIKTKKKILADFPEFDKKYIKDPRKWI